MIPSVSLYFEQTFRWKSKIKKTCFLNTYSSLAKQAREQDVQLYKAAIKIRDNLNDVVLSFFIVTYLRESSASTYYVIQTLLIMIVFRFKRS